MNDLENMAGIFTNATRVTAGQGSDTVFVMADQSFATHGYQHLWSVDPNTEGSDRPQCGNFDVMTALSHACWRPNAIEEVAR